jgi:hypothetical protein
VSAGPLVVFVVMLVVTGAGVFAFMLAVFGPLLGVATFDANRCRIDLARYRGVFGELPADDDDR